MKINNNMHKMPSVLRSRDVSRFLRISPDDITLLARRGYLKGYKLGRQWRFKRKDIMSWFKRHTRKEILDLIK
jgi:excisionase family DNA binding protein